METNIQINGSEAVIALVGRLDTPSAPQVETEVQKVTSSDAKSVLVDCSQLTYISSSGLRILISLHKHYLKSGGALTIKALSPEIKDVFDMTGFTNIFTIVE